MSTLRFHALKTILRTDPLQVEQKLNNPEIFGAMFLDSKRCAIFN